MSKWLRDLTGLDLGETANAGPRSNSHRVNDFLHIPTGHWSLVTGHWSLVTGHW